MVLSTEDNHYEDMPMTPEIAAATVLPRGGRGRGAGPDRYSPTCSCERVSLNT
jgi:hypothetical protein